MFFGNKQRNLYLLVDSISEICAEIEQSPLPHQERVKEIFIAKLESLCTITSEKNISGNTCASNPFSEARLVKSAIELISHVASLDKKGDTAVAQANELLRHYLIAIFFHSQALSSSKGQRYKTKRINHAQRIDAKIKKILHLESANDAYDFQNIESHVKIKEP